MRAALDAVAPWLLAATAGHRAAVEGLPRAAWRLALLSLPTAVAELGPAMFAVYLVAGHDFDGPQIGLVLLFFAAALSVGISVARPAVKRFGGRIILIATLVPGAYVMLLVPTVDDTGTMSMTAALAGFLFGFYRLAVEAAVQRGVERALRPRALALANGAGGVGLALMALVVFAGMAIDLDLAFALTAAILFATAVAVFLAARPKAAETGTAVAVEPAPSRWRLHDLFELLGDGPFIATLAITVLYYTCFQQILLALPMYLAKGLHYEPAAIGAVLAFFGLAGVAIEVPLVQRVRQFSPMSLVTAGLVLTALTFTLLVLRSGVGFILVALLLFCAGRGLVETYLPAHMASLAVPARQGRDTALLGSAQALGCSAGVSTYALLGHGRFQLLWLLTTVAAVGVALAAFGLRNALRREAGGGIGIEPPV